MKQRKILKIGLIFTISFLLQFVFMWLRGGYVTVAGLTGFPLSMLAFAVAYFIVTVLLLNRYAKALPVWTIVMALLIGTSLLDIYVRFLRPDGFRHTLISLPDFIVRLLAVGARRMVR